MVTSRKLPSSRHRQAPILVHREGVDQTGLSGAGTSTSGFFAGWRKRPGRTNPNPLPATGPRPAPAYAGRHGVALVRLAAPPNPARLRELATLTGRRNDR